jgi:endoglycosylceramidase
MPHRTGPPPIPWLAAWLLLGLLAAAGLPGAAATGLATTLGRPAPARTPLAGPLPWLHVEHPGGGRPFIADPQGRLVILRGAVSGGLVDYWSGTDPGTLRPAPYFPVDPAAYDGRCPENSPVIRQPPLCREDIAQMRALGFDVVRLALSWSLLEPQAGRYDRQYLDRVAQVVGWARAEGLYVILDLHENAWSRYLARPVPPPLPGGSPTALNQLSGAPPWAVLSGPWPSEVYLGQRELNPAAFAAFTSFWLNAGVAGPAGEAPGTGLEDHYLGALAALARRFRDDSTVAGYGVFNEPWPGFAPPPDFEDLLLYPFYRRVADALTGARDGLPCPASAPALPACGYPDLGVHDRSHLLFLEPDHLREQTDFATALPLPVSSYPNLVYAIHAYTHVFTLDALVGQDPRRAGYPPGGAALSYGSAEVEARGLRAALFVDEFGGEPAGDELLLTAQLRQQEQHLLGGTFWVWKENCALTTTWGVYDGVFGGRRDQRCTYDRPPASADARPKPENGCLRPERERLLARPRPRAVDASSDPAYAYDAATGAFQMTARARPGAPETLLSVPREVRGAVQVSGAAEVTATETDAFGGRLVRIRPTGGGYRAAILPAPLALTGCS